MFAFGSGSIQRGKNLDSRCQVSIDIKQDAKGKKNMCLDLRFLFDKTKTLYVFLQAPIYEQLKSFRKLLDYTKIIIKHRKFSH